MVHFDAAVAPIPAFNFLPIWEKESNVRLPSFGLQLPEKLAPSVSTSADTRQAIAPN